MKIVFIAYHNVPTYGGILNTYNEIKIHPNFFYSHKCPKNFQSHPPRRNQNFHHRSIYTLKMLKTIQI